MKDIATITASVWRWIDRDLDNARPISALLFIVPFVPFGITLELVEDQRTQDAFLFGGLVVAVPWMLYVIWRGIIVVGKSFKDSARYFRDLPLSPRERSSRLFWGALAALVAASVIIYIRHLA